MLLLRLFWEFFKTGLFAVGGGMATLPFLSDIAESTGWYTQAQLMDMLAVSESTPGPIGINMATYVGFTVAGIPGALIATLGEITPCVGVILIVAMVLKNFRHNRYVESAFYGLRPASSGLIAAAGIGVVTEVLIHPAMLTAGNLSAAFDWPGIVLAAVLLVLTNWIKPTQKLHPIVFIAASAVIGVALGFGG